MSAIERQLVDLVKQKGYGLCTVESVTGGQLAQRITAIPGASEVFWAGLVVYDATAKEEIALVPSTLIEAHGVVSAPVATAMAKGGLDRMVGALAPLPKATTTIVGRKGYLAISTTGLAGPGGGKPDKPVGLCFVGLARDGFTARAVELRLPLGLTRAEYQKEFADQALRAALDYLQN